MDARKRDAKRRNNRHWYEWGDACVIDVPGRGPVLVSVCGVSEYRPGEVIYDVEEACSGMRYPVDARHLRPVKDRAETDELIKAGRDRGERRSGPLPQMPELK